MVSIPSILNRLHGANQTILVILFLLSTLTACSSNDNHDHPALKTGKDLYNLHCAECHGEDGTGRLVDRTPANILTQKRQQEIIDYITTEVDSTRKMPVFSNMPRSEASKIAQYLVYLKQLYEATPDEKKKNKALLIQP